MNTYKIYLRRAFERCRNLTRQHSDIIASATCGLVMSMLFLSYLGENEAKRATLVPIDDHIVVEETTQSATLTPLPAPPTSSEQTPIITETRSEGTAISDKEISNASAEEHRAAPTEEDGVSSRNFTSEVATHSSKHADASDFPAFDHTSFPVAKTPNWGAMRTPAEWNRAYADMTPEDYVAIPRYDMSKLTIPMSSINNPVTEANIPIITAKLFYSTRYLGQYDLDAAEGSGKHAGVDLKLPRGTPIGAIAGGRVSYIGTSHDLGLFVMVEHRLKSGETFYSIYAHFDRATVTVGQDIEPGEQLGNVGMTGNTSGPHLHLQVDRGEPGGNHTPFQEGGDAATGMVNPITFISMYRNGER